MLNNFHKQFKKSQYNLKIELYLLNAVIMNIQ